MKNSTRSLKFSHIQLMRENLSEKHKQLITSLVETIRYCKDDKQLCRFLMDLARYYCPEIFMEKVNSESKK